MDNVKRLSDDEAFLKTLKDIVLNNLENEQFGVEQLAKKAGYSRFTILRKLQHINGLSIARFIREIRLNKALELLKRGDEPVSEIAYKVGFGSPTYFNKCFHDHYGVTPGEIRRNAGDYQGQMQKNVQIGNTNFADSERSSSEIEESPLRILSSNQVDRYYQGNRRTWQIAGISIFFAIALIAAYLAISYLTEISGNEMAPLEKTIVVLPLRDDSPNRDKGYLCYGIRSEINAHLQTITSLKIRSETTADNYKGTEKSIPEIGKETDAAYVLEGAVQSYGNQIKVNVQLIETKTDCQIWSDSYEGEFSEEIFEFQSRIALQIASSLDAVITPEQEQRIRKMYTSHIDAYDLRIQGDYELRQYWRDLDQRHLSAAQGFHKRALKHDPDYIMSIWSLGAVYHARKQYDSALLFANKLIRQDSNFYLGYLLKGRCNLALGKSDSTIQYYQKAINMIPKGDSRSIWPMVELGGVYGWLQVDPIKALNLQEEGLALEKEYLPAVFRGLGHSFLTTGDYKRAEEYYIKSLRFRMDCNDWSNLMRVSILQSAHINRLPFIDSICNNGLCRESCAWAGVLFHYYRFEFTEAFKKFRDYERMGIKNWMIDSLVVGCLQLKTGHQADALTILNQHQKSLLKRLETYNDKRTFIYLSSIHAMKGEHRKAIEYLHEAVAFGLQSGYHDLIEMDPIFEDIRDDPEFKALVHQAKEDKRKLRLQVDQMIESGELVL